MDTKVVGNDSGNSPSKDDHSDGDIQFLLAEFNGLNELYRHTNSRVYTSLNFYLTFAVAAATVAVLLFGYVSDTRVFLIALLPMLSAIFLLGYFLADQVAKSTRTTREYLLGLNLIRHYFAHEYQHIAPYLILPTVSPTGSREQDLVQARPRGSNESVVVISLINSIVLGCMSGTVVWILTAGNGWVLSAAVGVGIGVTCVAFMVLRRHIRRRYSV